LEGRCGVCGFLRARGPWRERTDMSSGSESDTASRCSRRSVRLAAKRGRRGGGGGGGNNDSVKKRVERWLSLSSEAEVQELDSQGRELNVYNDGDDLRVLHDEDELEQEDDDDDEEDEDSNFGSGDEKQDESAGEPDQQEQAESENNGESDRDEADVVNDGVNNVPSVNDGGSGSDMEGFVRRDSEDVSSGVPSSSSSSFSASASE
jgi:hypothetical protein